MYGAFVIILFAIVIAAVVWVYTIPSPAHWSANAQVSSSAKHAADPVGRWAATNCVYP
jgi:Tfp pilus assembly protein FimT